MCRPASGCREALALLLLVQLAAQRHCTLTITIDHLTVAELHKAAFQRCSSVSIGPLAQKPLPVSDSNDIWLKYSSYARCQSSA